MERRNLYPKIEFEKNLETNSPSFSLSHQVSHETKKPEQHSDLTQKNSNSNNGDHHHKDLYSNSGRYSTEEEEEEDEIDWDSLINKNKEITMWDIVSEMLASARAKFRSGPEFPWGSSNFSEQILVEADFGNFKEILDSDPPKWLADSSASSCMLCNSRFHPILCSRHHCRFCGAIFCNGCSKGRRLLPVKFRAENPQRVCDVCSVRLEPAQTHLMGRVSRASQTPTRDLTDLSTLRSWVNLPCGGSMESEIYKATNTIKGYNKVGTLKHEKLIPDSILREAKGLVIITIAKVGVMVTYKLGTGLVIARKEDGSWSPPSAISSFGIGYGAQAGGKLTDFIIVLKTESAVKTFSGNFHFSVGAGLSAAAGIVGRVAEADLHAGVGGCASSYTYSCSKGAFIGCSLEGSVFTTRREENSRFYGNSSISTLDILLGSLPRPPAAAMLYHSLSNLFAKLES